MGKCSGGLLAFAGAVLSSVVTTEGKVRLSASLARMMAQKAWLYKRVVDGVVGWYAGVVMGRGGDG